MGILSNRDKFRDGARIWTTDGQLLVDLSWKESSSDGRVPSPKDKLSHSAEGDGSHLLEGLIVRQLPMLCIPAPKRVS